MEAVCSQYSRKSSTYSINVDQDQVIEVRQVYGMRFTNQISHSLDDIVPLHGVMVAGRWANSELSTSYLYAP